MARNRRTGTSLALVGTLGWACYGAGAWSLAQSGFNTGSATGQTESLFGDAPAAESSAETPGGQTVKVSDLGEIDLHVKDLEITKVLQLLSLQSQRNIVASRNVAGTISADLYGVDFYEALDAILHTNGFGYKEEGSFIYVYTAQELKEIAEVERKLEVKVVRLNYLTAGDASTFVTPLLSDVGEIALSGEVPGGLAPSISDAGRNTNSLDEVLVIRDYAENLDQIVNVIAELDRRPVQVQIEATIMEASLDDATGWGVDLSILADWELSNFTDPLNVVDSVLTGDVVGGGEDTTKFDVLQTGAGWQTTVGNTANGPAGIKFGVLSDHVAAFVRALDEVTDTTIIARPKLLVLNRQRADLLIGSKLGYVSTTQTETSATQTVEFLDVGTQLTIRPFVSADEFIRLEVSPKVSNGSVGQLGSFVVPNETTNELVTNVMVRNGQTVVLGGMFKEDTTVSRAQVPGLGDVPLIGAALQGQDDTVDRSEVIFMITPTVVHDQYLTDVGRRAEDAVEIARLGTREEMLPFSRSKLTAFHVRKAREHLDAGNIDRARWHLKLALTMDPTLLEARRMQEKLDGERIWWPDRSLLEYAVDGAVDEHIKSLPISSPAKRNPGANASPDDDPFGLLLDDLDPQNSSRSAISFEAEEGFQSGPSSQPNARFYWDPQGEFEVSEPGSFDESFTPSNEDFFIEATEDGNDSAVQVDQQWTPTSAPTAPTTPTTPTTSSEDASSWSAPESNKPAQNQWESPEWFDDSPARTEQTGNNASDAGSQSRNNTSFEANSNVWFESDPGEGESAQQQTKTASTGVSTGKASSTNENSTDTSSTTVTFDRAVEVTTTTEPSAGAGQATP